MHSILFYWFFGINDIFTQKLSICNEDMFISFIKSTTNFWLQTKFQYVVRKHVQKVKENKSNTTNTLTSAMNEPNEEKGGKKTSGTL